MGFLRAALVVIVVTGAAAIAERAAQSDEPRSNGRPIEHALFDANDCLDAVRPVPWDSAIEFHWSCPARELVTISCVFDRFGYHGLGPEFAEPGWHCNHPLPVLEDEGGARISDVAIGDTRGRYVWAACAVTDLGDFAERVKPYHSTACYRALIGIKRAVNREGRDPEAAAAEILP